MGVPEQLRALLGGAAGSLQSTFLLFSWFTLLASGKREGGAGAGREGGGAAPPPLLSPQQHQAADRHQETAGEHHHVHTVLRVSERKEKVLVEVRVQPAGDGQSENGERGEDGTGQQ